MSSPLIYRDEDFEHGLMCARCPHVFRDGEVFSSVLTGFQDDIPLVLLVCPDCARGETESVDHTAERAE